MNISRTILLWMSENSLLKNKIPKLKFVRKAIKKFMPGETEYEAILAAEKLLKDDIGVTFTKLGENITQIAEAEKVKNHYLQLIQIIKNKKLNIELSIKLTQLGFDLDEEVCFKYCEEIINSVKLNLGNTLFIDMEGSSYTQRTIDFYKRLKTINQNVGICLQAYLYRTQNDLSDLLVENSKIRLVKGAYREAKEIAYPLKKDVDKNYLDLSKKMLMKIKENSIRIIFGTHDDILIEKIIKEAKYLNISKEHLEFQMLYGIKNEYLKDLVKRGYKGSILIAYGNSWYAWYMRRLAERPANIWFVLKNIF
ncbi:MAG: proline dehydrogenase family protein [Melioribacteraceae bacterium]|nr:proline dehydrogenase family protein [Melioribacteraceae bacterium]